MIIFSEKRNIIFLDDTRKIIFQRDFVGNIIFSEHLEKENMAFRAINRLADIENLFPNRTL